MRKSWARQGSGKGVFTGVRPDSRMNGAYVGPGFQKRNPQDVGVHWLWGWEAAQAPGVPTCVTNHKGGDALSEQGPLSLSAPISHRTERDTRMALEKT